MKFSELLKVLAPTLKSIHIERAKDNKFQIISFSDNSLTVYNRLMEFADNEVTYVGPDSGKADILRVEVK